MKNEFTNLIKNNEHWFQGDNHPLRYLFMQEKTSNHLLVVLSGFNGKEAQGVAGKYNYIRSLETLKINKLFIKDGIENVPVYYYGINGKQTYLDDVINLIEEKLASLNLDRKNLIISGSSKGGTGALITGFEMGAGHIIAGANQLFVGTYLTEINSIVQNKMFSKIIGDLDDRESRVNKLFESKLLIDQTESNLYFHAGNRDTHYIKHMKPLLNHFDNKNIFYELDLRNYEGHEKVGPYFAIYLPNKIEQILNEVEILKPEIENIEEDSFTINLKINNFKKEEMEVAIYFYKNKSKILELPYDSNMQREVKLPINEVTRTTIFLKEGKIVTKTLKVNISDI